METITYIMQDSSGQFVAVVATDLFTAYEKLALVNTDKSWQLYNMVSVSNPIGYLYNDGKG